MDLAQHYNNATARAFAKLSDQFQQLNVATALAADATRQLSAQFDALIVQTAIRWIQTTAPSCFQTVDAFMRQHLNRRGNFWLEEGVRDALNRAGMLDEKDCIRLPGDLQDADGAFEIVPVSPR